MLLFVAGFFLLMYGYMEEVTPVIIAGYLACVLFIVSMCALVNPPFKHSTKDIKIVTINKDNYYMISKNHLGNNYILSDGVQGYVISAEKTQFYYGKPSLQIKSETIPDNLKWLYPIEDIYEYIVTVP